jgi:hypothetical protein
MVAMFRTWLAMLMTVRCEDSTGFGGAERSRYKPYDTLCIRPDRKANARLCRVGGMALHPDTAQRPPRCATGGFSNETRTDRGGLSRYRRATFLPTAVTARSRCAMMAARSAHPALQGQPLLVLVVMVAVSCMSATVVNVVDVITMRHRHVATAIAMHMVVLRMHRMLTGGFAFVVVIVVPSMEMTIV